MKLIFISSWSQVINAVKNYYKLALKNAVCKDILIYISGQLFSSNFSAIMLYSFDLYTPKNNLCNPNNIFEVHYAS